MRDDIKTDLLKNGVCREIEDGGIHEIMFLCNDLIVLYNAKIQDVPDLARAKHSPL